MVRTKADGGGSRKAIAAKAPRKVSTPTRSTSDSSSSGKKSSGGGGNALVSRPVPEWQKPISMFFTKTDKPENQFQPEPTSNKENDQSAIQVEHVHSSDEEEVVRTSKKVLDKRRQNDFLDSDDDD